MKIIIKQINLKTSLILLFAIVALSGCFKDRIDIDLNKDNKKVVVEAWITNLDEPQFVKLSYTSNYFNSTGLSAINGAKVELSNGYSDYSLNEKEDGTYYLPNNWVPMLDSTYTLTIKIDDEEYKSTSVMRKCPKIEHLIIDKFEDELGSEFIVLSFNFKETKGEGDGYFIRDYKLNSLRKDSLSNGAYISDEFIDGILLEDISVTQEGFEIGDTAVIDLFSIGIDAVNFLQDLTNEVYKGGFFDPPPVNIRTNISNGAIGYFIIGGASRDTIIIN